MTDWETRQRIVTAAIDRFQVRGYGSCDVREIIGATGLSEEVFVEYFKDKELLALEAIESYWDQLRTEALLDSSMTPARRLRTHFEHIATMYSGFGLERGCLIAKFAKESGALPARIRKDVEDATARWSDLVSRVVREGQEDGSIGTAMDGDKVARFLVNSWSGSVTSMKVLGSRSPIDDFFSITFSAVIRC